MSNRNHHYEVFVASCNGFTGGDPGATNWSWRKLDHNGMTIVHGTNHGSLQACFAAVRAHRTIFGTAPITINLREAGVSDTPGVVDLSATGCDAGVADIQFEQDQRRQHRARELADNAVSPASRSLYLKIADEYAARIAIRAIPQRRIANL